MGKKGSLVGGRACAEQGLRANRLGNQAGLATYVQLGTGERLHRQELDLNEAVRSVTFEIERVRWTNSKRLGSVRVKKSEKRIVVFSKR